MKGSIRRRGKTSWELRYDSPETINGKRKQITETVHGARRDAERTLREKLTTIEGGTFVTKSNQSLREFMEEWLSTYVATNTRPSSISWLY